MADAKKYYYMRLNEGYFESDEQKLLESMPDGYLYSNILLKLYLKSLKRNGLLMFNDRIPYNAQMIATITRHQVGTVEKAMEIFQHLGIVEILDSGAIYMMDVQNFVGKTSTEADRIRAYRAKLEEEKNKAQALPEAPCPEETEDSYKCTPKKEKKKEININKKIYSDVISYLNEKAGTKYRASTSKTQSLIRARVAEDFTLDDFKIVIDKKCAEWLGDEKMEKYLRPETLFGTKFENYLNAKVASKQPINTGHAQNADQNDLDDYF